MDGDMDRVKSLIKTGVDPNLRDSSRYTALVRMPTLLFELKRPLH